MKKQQWVVRIIMQEDRVDRLPSELGLWLREILRYAGIVRFVEGRYEGRMVFDLYPPVGERDSKLWANQNADRIKSFGINAAAAPAVQ